ncbi:MAG: hypothetical protein ACK5LP_10340 [Campylobacteraceae bacterium]
MKKVIEQTTLFSFWILKNDDKKAYVISFKKDISKEEIQKYLAYKKDIQEISILKKMPTFNFSEVKEFGNKVQLHEITKQ